MMFFCSRSHAAFNALGRHGDVKTESLRPCSGDLKTTYIVSIGVCPRVWIYNLLLFPWLCRCYVLKVRFSQSPLDAPLAGSVQKLKGGKSSQPADGGVAVRLGIWAPGGSEVSPRVRADLNFVFPAEQLVTKDNFFFLISFSAATDNFISSSAATDFC